MTSKITLAPWPGTSPAPKVVKTAEPETVADVPLSEEVGTQMVKALNCLHVEYGVGLNRLMRAVGLASDLKSVFGNRKHVRATLVDDVAQAVGMTTPELLSIKTLSLPRQIEVAAHLKQKDLLEPLRGFMVGRRNNGKK